MEVPEISGAVLDDGGEGSRVRTQQDRQGRAGQECGREIAHPSPDPYPHPIPDPAQARARA